VTVAVVTVAQQPEPTVTREVASVLPIERPSAASGATAYQQMYIEACSPGADGRVALDTERFARALANTRVGVMAEQRLYHLGVLAAAEGEAGLALEDVITALAV
jgi:hypothetical protein